MVTKNDRDMLTRLIGFFLILAVIFLIAHFCVPEANGQTPPMNPVTYNWVVDPLGIYINTLDTYRVLQQHSAGIDTLQSLNELVFSACDSTGGQAIADDDSAYINLDKEVVEASIYVHAADDYTVAVNQSGTYAVSYSVNATTATGTSGLITVLCRYSSSWLNVAGTLMENPANNLAHASTSATTIIPLNAGDSLAIKMKHNGLGSENILTVANGVTLIIQRLY